LYYSFVYLHAQFFYQDAVVAVLILKCQRSLTKEHPSRMSWINYALLNAHYSQLVALV